MGSGTTIVEAIVNNRIGIGTDINEIATLISKVKTTPIDCNLLLQNFENLVFEINFNPIDGIKKFSKLPERIDYWFKPHIKDKLLVIMNHILKINNTDVRDFFLVSFSQILKSCSIWLQKSIKPTRDFNKKEIYPLYKFKWQTNRMIKKHKEFNKILSSNIIENIKKYRIIKNGTSTDLPCRDETSMTTIADTQEDDYFLKL